MKRSYSTDLSDAEWGCIEPYVPPPNRRGRPKIHTTREILHAIFLRPQERLPLAALAP
jgi:putative transposase